MKFSSLKEYDHEEVFPLNLSGVKAFIAIHRSRNGISFGGTRMMHYEDERLAIKDVLRLSKAMSYKCFFAGLSYGGAKGVIMADPSINSKKTILRAYAQEVQRLRGRFRTGEDVGISQQDVEFMLPYCEYLVGKPNLAGDPSVFAARSTFFAMRAANYFLTGAKTLAKRKIAVKGVGKVGSSLIAMLEKDKAEVFFSDIDQHRVNTVRLSFPRARVVSSESIGKISVDIFSPCALGDDITTKNVNSINAKIICGAANNQLEAPELAEVLFERKVIYVPDFIANAGGLIAVAAEIDQGVYSREHVEERIALVYDRVLNLLKMAQKKNMPVNTIALSIADISLTKK